MQHQQAPEWIQSHALSETMCLVGRKLKELGDHDNFVAGSVGVRDFIRKTKLEAIAAMVKADQGGKGEEAVMHAGNDVIDEAIHGFFQ